MVPLRAAFTSLANRPTRYWLWMLVIALACIVVTFTATNAFLASERAVDRDTFGQDFLAFYSAGRMVDAGTIDDLYDLAAMSQLQSRIARESDLHLAATVAPWLNPPHAALYFAPLASLSYRTALWTWWAFSLLCLGGAMGVMACWVRDLAPAKKDWLLVPALLLLAPPTIQALGHGQNSLLSLLILTLSVAAWRNREPLWAGLACSLLFYKPQLAAVVCVAMLATLGWRVMVGLILGLVPQLLAGVVAMPGSMTLFLERVPAILHFIQDERSYDWHRLTTMTGFWRFLLQGNAPGVTHAWISAISIASSVAVVATLIAVGWKRRSGEDVILRERFIALVLLATPLTVPYFFDYDLLLLSVAGVLITRDLIVQRDGHLMRFVGVVAFAWLLVNPVLAESHGLNFTVPLLTILFVMQTRRCLNKDTLAAVEPLQIVRSNERLAA